jgi:hypothetical protein
MPDDIPRRDENEESEDADDGLERGIGESEDEFDDEDDLDDEEEEELDTPRGRGGPRDR